MRARESTCDRHGLACSGSSEGAARALAALAAGAERWKKLDVAAYVGQARHTSGFWMSFFNGRASRSEYWWFALFIVIGNIVLSFIGHALPLLFALATLLPSIAAAARRLHDTDRSGWMQLISLIPIVGWIVMIYFLAQEPKEPNRFGPATSIEPAAS